MSCIIEKLYLGSFEIAQNQQFLQQNQIKQVLVMAKELEFCFPSLAVYKKIELKDENQCFLFKFLVEGLEFIETSIKKGQQILVHCMGGKSRSSAMVIAYIMLKFNFEFSEALQYVQSKHPKADPNTGFQYQLTVFSQCLQQYRQIVIMKSTEDFNILDEVVGEQMTQVSIGLKEFRGTKKSYIEYNKKEENFQLEDSEQGGAKKEEGVQSYGKQQEEKKLEKQTPNNAKNEQKKSNKNPTETTQKESPQSDQKKKNLKKFSNDLSQDQG